MSVKTVRLISARGMLAFPGCVGGVSIRAKMQAKQTTAAITVITFVVHERVGQARRRTLWVWPFMCQLSISGMNPIPTRKVIEAESNR